MRTIQVARVSFAFCAAILLGLGISPTLAKGGGHGGGGGGRPSFGGGSGESKKAATGTNFNTVNGPGPKMTTGARPRVGGGIGGGLGRGRGGGYYGGYPNSGVTSNSAVWGAGPQWGTGGAGSPSLGHSGGASAGNLQVQTYNWPTKGASPDLGGASALVPSNQTASAQPGSPIDDLLKATSK